MSEQINLFAPSSNTPHATHSHAPLADRMRPKTLDVVVGQEALIGPGKLLRRAIESNRLSSIILWGSSGCGKTTLAMVIAEVTKRPFARLNAVTDGLPELRKLIKKAEDELNLYGRQTRPSRTGFCHRWKRAPSSLLAPPPKTRILASTAPSCRVPLFLN